MKQRGRKVNNDLAVIEGSVNERPEPPSLLCAKGAEVWNYTVCAMPAIWYTTAIKELLTNYCRQAVIVANYDALLEETLTPKDYMAVTTNRAKQASLLMSMATKLRITPQSTFDADKLGRHKSRLATGTKPWERKK